ncbi:porin [Algoriphagus sp. oki45]|uniref:porin n=1 Tax=Algoriphagus sp. oki45 TaxID=3067294 RepID=UPI0027FB28B9|nr:porin [Algoriphagus sp. oki45]
MRKRILVFALITLSQWSFSQEAEDKPQFFSFSAFLDLYYGYDFNEPLSKKRLPFLYNHTRHDQPAVNLALISGSFQKDRFRANLGLQQGNYASDNYADEPAALRWISQANFGVALDQDQKVWLDAGVLPSRIGFESAISKDNLTLSRSLIAENSPYFETGVKLGWQKSETWYFALLYLNGWQRIRAIPGKNVPSFGTQANFKPNSNLTLNWSTFLGTDQPLEAGTYLYFSNMYADFSLGNRWKLVAGVDVGKRTQADAADRNWWGLSAIARYRFSDGFMGAIRYEYFGDPFQAIADSGGNLGVETSGFSLNLDKQIGQWSLLRAEGRWLDSQVPLEQGFSPAESENFFFLVSWAFFWTGSN